MKNIFTIALLLLASFASAQIVNIPDPAFKSYLLGNADTNHDGEVQVTEAQAVTKLMHAGSGVNDFTGIRAFSNLDSFDIWNGAGHVTNLDLSAMSVLRWVKARNIAYLDSVNISGCSNLNHLDLSSSSSESPFSNFNCSGAVKLAYLDLGDAALSNLDLRSLINLDTLLCGPNFNNHNHIDTLNLEGLSKLHDVRLTTTIGSLYAQNCSVLNRLMGNQGGLSITDLADLSNCVNLQRLEILNYYPITFDLSSCIALTKLYMPHVFNLRNLNLKNGSALTSMHVYLEPACPPMNICADDFEIGTLTSYFQTMSSNGPQYTTVNISSLCTNFPGGVYNLIKGKIRLDANSNGCDNNDAGMAHVPTKITDGSGISTIVMTNQAGLYKQYNYAGNFNVRPYFPYPYFNVNPVSTNINFPSINNLVDSADFCILPNGVHNQVDIRFLPIRNASPGFITGYELHYRNRGTTIMSGDIQLNFDNSRMSFTNSYPMPAMQLPAQLTWNYSNLSPFEDRSIFVYLTMFAPPVNNIGDTLIYLATINPVAGDEVPSDNSFILPQLITSSYDPNHKQCLENSKVDISHINDYLHYTIQFQNLGTDTAYNIAIADTMSNNYDWESFDFISASHPCNVKRVNNKLVFYFENILLPYQAINDAGSNGYIAFQVKPKNTLAVGDSLNNTASIYFDFNYPVRTNKSVTIVSTFVPVPVRMEYFSLNSKDESNLLTWKVATTDLTTIFNIERSNDGIHFSNIGNITATAQRCQLPFNFTDDKPLNGKNYYRIKITDANNVSFYSKILVAGKTKSGFEIITITSDQNNTNLYLNVSKDQTVNMKMIAADGKMVYSQNKTIAAGTNQLNIQTGNLAKGIYTLIVNTIDGELITKRFIH